MSHEAYLNWKKEHSSNQPSMPNILFPEDGNNKIDGLAKFGLITVVFSSLAGIYIANRNFSKAQDYYDKNDEARIENNRNAAIVFNTLRKHRQFVGYTSLVFAVGSAILTAVIVLGVLKHYYPHKNINLELVKKLAIAGSIATGGGLIFLALGKSGRAPFVNHSEGLKAFKKLESKLKESPAWSEENPLPYDPSKCIITDDLL